MSGISKDTLIDYCDLIRRFEKNGTPFALSSNSKKLLEEKEFRMTCASIIFQETFGCSLEGRIRIP